LKTCTWPLTIAAFGGGQIRQNTPPGSTHSMPVTRIPAAAKIGQTGPDPHPMSRIDSAAYRDAK